MYEVNRFHPFLQQCVMVILSFQAYTAELFHVKLLENVFPRQRKNVKNEQKVLNSAKSTKKETIRTSVVIAEPIQNNIESQLYKETCNEEEASKDELVLSKSFGTELKCQLQTGETEYMQSVLPNSRFIRTGSIS